jgi:hypothetical protein
MAAPTHASQARDRLVLENIPKINFYEGGPRCPEDLCIPSVLRALGEFFGDEMFGCKTCRALQPGCQINCAYSFFVGVTGVAAFLSWKKGWNDSNAAFYMSADPEAPERWGYRALGYPFTWLEKKPAAGEPDEGRARFLRAIVESLEQGRPVVAYGVVGPPEPALIAGYDEGGEVLIGWSFFQSIPDFSTGVEFEPGGYFRKRDWFKDTFCLLVLGERQERPPLKQIFRDALEWMVKVARNPRVRPEADAPEWYRGRANGLAAYTAWAESLLQDGDYAGLDEAGLRQAFEIHNSAVGQVAEARWYGSQFLLQAANPDYNPPLSLAEDLYHAAGYYAAEHDLMWKLWDLAGGNGNPDGWKYLGDPEIRRKMAEVILQAREKDALAIEAIERNLTLWH